MGTLLDAIGIVLETHFRFEFANGSPIGDSLMEWNMASVTGWAGAWKSGT